MASENAALPSHKNICFLKFLTILQFFTVFLKQTNAVLLVIMKTSFWNKKSYQPQTFKQ